MIVFRPGHRGGFTLIELLIVVAVILVMSATAAVSLPRFRADALLNAATELQSVLAVTRETAIAMRDPLPVTLHIASNSVSYFKPGGQAATLQFNGTIGYSSGLGNGDLTLEFDAFGHPNVQVLPVGTSNLGDVAWGYDVAGGYGFVTLETKGGGFIIQVLVHKNTGETEIQWVKR